MSKTNRDERYGLLEQGQTCVANIKTDKTLVEWAGDRAVYIGREYKKRGYNYEDSDWRNEHTDKPNEIAVGKYRADLLKNPELLSRIEELRGKLLVCWCYPKPCHGDILAELANAV